MGNKCLLVLSKIAAESDYYDERLGVATAWMVDKDCIIIHDDTAYRVKYMIEERNDDAWEALQAFYIPTKTIEIASEEIFDTKWKKVALGA